MFRTKKVALLGSTGSIGCNTLAVIDNLILHGYGISVKYLTTNRQTDKLSPQIEKYKPSAVVILDKSAYDNFVKQDHGKTEILFGREGLMEIAGRDDYNFLVNALVGFSGFEPTIAALKKGKDTAIANKETLVTGGKIVTALLKKNGNHLYPIDSEHSAILQCLAGEDPSSVEKFILTASGGPFLKHSKKDLKSVTVESALAHPNWKMGSKITIDSATMMNKGLEVIEARWLFDTPPEKINVLMHPQSIIHSMVEFTDGSVKAQLGVPDMKIPIQYSLTYPERVISDYKRLDLAKTGTLTFEEPDLDKFRCLKIAFDVLKNEGTFATVMNAANEMAVELFLQRKISFNQIADIIESELDGHENTVELTPDNILLADSLTRKSISEKYH